MSNKINNNMLERTINKLIGKYISGLGPEVQAIIKEMYDYRYAPRPEGEKPPKGYPIKLEKRIIDVLTIALQNRRNFLDYEDKENNLYDNQGDVIQEIGDPNH